MLDSVGNVGLTEIYAEMRSEDTGLCEEILVHVVTLFQRMVARFLMNGYNVIPACSMPFHVLPE
ncbi:hypothetical protein AALM74_10640 [Parabacteroides segnis]|uniref:hypothetical protein n=1 Tax=Parabacteroides segnis TaxID=2763058 RepID=UPI003514D07A